MRVHRLISRSLRKALLMCSRITIKKLDFRDTVSDIAYVNIVYIKAVTDLNLFVDYLFKGRDLRDFLIKKYDLVT